MTFAWIDPDEIRVDWLATNPSRDAIRTVFEWFLEAMRDPNSVDFEELDDVRMSSIGGVLILWMVFWRTNELALVAIRSRG